MSILWQDIIYGIRMLAKKPFFTAVAALSLALGIGLNTAIFTLVNTILLGSLPYKDPGRLVVISTVPPQHRDQTNGVSVPDFLAWKERAHSFEAIGALNNSARSLGSDENGTPAEQIQGEDFSPGLLSALGAQPMLGRWFTEAEDGIDHPAPVIVISHRLWQRRFHGDPGILGKTLRMEGENISVIGVLPPDFRLTDDDADYAAPILFNRFQLRGSARFLFVVAKLKPGVSMQQAQGEMDSIAGQLAKEFPARDTAHGKPWGVRVQGIREGLFGFMSKPLLLLQGAVGFVLLIACANVGALLLSRASSRQNEVAIRSALGAGRGRIFRQFLTESILLSLAGGVFGVLLAWWGVRALVAMAPPWFPRLHEISLDARVLVFSAFISLLTGLIFGLVPALQGSRLNFVASLKDSTRGGTAGAARSRLRSLLVASQLALALVLLIGSGLLVRSFLRMQGAELGCDPTGLLTVEYRLPTARFGKPTGTYKGFPLWEFSTQPAVTMNQIFERLQSVPGVKSAAGTVMTPLNGAPSVNFTIDGTTAQSEDLSTLYYPITPNFFNTMKIPFLRGRDFSPHDTVTSAWVTIVNESMAKRFWPNEDPIGKHIKLDLAPDEQPREVIGVVHDTPSSRRQTRLEPAMYIPFAQVPAHTIGPFQFERVQIAYVLRSQGDPMSIAPAVRQAVAQIDPDRPLTNVRTVEQDLALQVQYPRYYSMLLGLFAAIATALAAVGIYGVMAYAVEQRTREIGIRMALGAAGWDVLKLVGRQALVVIATGLVVGVAGAVALTRFISSELWEVSAMDPATFGGVSILLASIALLACFIPTRRAVRVDPTIALRYE